MAEKKDLKKTDLILATNLRNLRKAYGESLEDVAEALHIGRSTVAAYETGKRGLPQDLLYAYSNHFMVPVDDLMYVESSGVKIKYDEKLLLKFVKMIDVFFPIRECEIENDHYKRACQLHKGIYDLVKKRDQNPFYKCEECEDEYIKAMEDSVADDAAVANYIALLFLMSYETISLSEAIKTKPAILRKAAIKNQEAEKILYDLDPKLNEDVHAAVNEIRGAEFTKKIVYMIKQLKKTKDWADLADYYIALQYYLNIVDNNSTPNMNRAVGNEMLDAFAKIGNPYAKKLKTMLLFS